MCTRRPAFDCHHSRSHGDVEVGIGGRGLGIGKNNAQADFSSSYPTPNPQPPAPSRVRRGVTLLELLIVMTIMLMVTAAAIPVMMPALQNRRMREASRLTSSFISGARARAIETGRPAGVMLERFNGLPMAMQITYVEVPPPYSGDTLNSKLFVSPIGAITFMGMPPGPNPGPPGPPDYLWKGMIRIGDTVRLDYKGQLYTISQAGALNTPGAVITDAPAAATPWQLVTSAGVAPFGLPAGYMNSGVPFQIIRQPVRSSATPLQLPEGTVIDLICSGVAPTNTFASLTTDPLTWLMMPPVPFNPVIMFSPNGRVDSVTVNGAPIRPGGPIYLLVGRRDLMQDVVTSMPPVDENLFDPRPVPQNAYLSNFWVTVAHQTGQVSVSENARTMNATDIAGARIFAQTPQSAGGR